MTKTQLPTFVRLEGAIQHYEWGKLGSSDGMVSQIYLHQQRNNNNINNPDLEKPFAELWMGTHPNGPSKVYNTERKDEPVLLRDFLKSMNIEEVVGRKVSREFPDGNLPYLFKVLSVNKALSIQAHPDKALAEKLHKNDPKNYKDDNHKPELACALTRFEALCCFRPLEEIARALKEVPELRRVIGDEVVRQFEDDYSKLASDDTEGRKRCLRLIYTSLMHRDGNVIAEELKNLVDRINNNNITDKDSQLVLRLYQQYPGDVGCFSVYFLNHIVVQPGEAIFLAPNEPHAYLYGDCIECMACSDNVVRAGLTPKFKDVDNLCNMLTYKDDMVSRLWYRPTETSCKQLDEYTCLYVPPVKEFQVLRVSLPQGASTKWSFDSASIAIVLDGEGELSLTSDGQNEPCDTITVQKGDIICIFADVQVKCKSSRDLLAFVAAAHFD